MLVVAEALLTIRQKLLEMAALVEAAVVELTLEQSVLVELEALLLQVLD